MDFLNRILLVSSRETHKPYSNTPGIFIEKISENQLIHHNLWGYTAVIISSWPRESILSRSTQKLTKYVNQGGILVCIGCQSYESKWIPFCNWKNEDSQKIFASKGTKDSDIIFRNINDLSLLKFHEYYGHGTIDAPNESKSLIFDEYSRALLCVVDQGCKGAVLLTTIDVDHHIFVGIRSINKEKQEEKIRTAGLFINNILNWCKWKYTEKHTVKSYLTRKFLGFFSLRSFFLLFTLFIWPFSIYVSYIYLKNKNYDKWVMASGIASLLGFSAYITEKFWSIKNK